MKTVLVVEDEALVRWSAAAHLEELGYDVLEAASAAEAIMILESRADISLLFTDVNMPGMDGLRLAEAVSKRWPPVRIVVTSALALKGRIPEGAKFLPKPYRIDGLGAAFSSLLEA